MKYVIEIRRQSKGRPGLTVEIEFNTKEEAEAYLQKTYEDYVKGQEATVDYETITINEELFQKEIIIRKRNEKGKKVFSLLLTTFIKDF
ncbi:MULTISPECIES: hypothetical protein [unclassified Fictibacillus]|uniref:hypothetical protein n=1 Tax=unclassified Fictibacillus TaxID=2644029 RepID=UPI0007855F43|nr:MULTISPECIES: hypothetical protein [unclassified Fictibacillus]MED2971236.1 hypothetical protein [Fictibacillus sp. B-59209]UZJ80054.1 hypothetical protein OKX00_06180 [Fictibacillus sp. KU28468]SFD50733.1 hypothetical protein SAMN05428981_101696 [Bacillus sp. OV194]